MDFQCFSKDAAYYYLFAFVCLALRLVDSLHYIFHSQGREIVLELISIRRDNYSDRFKRLVMLSYVNPNRPSLTDLDLESPRNAENRIANSSSR